MIFSTVNNELAIFGNTIDEIKDKIDKFNEKRKKSNLFGEDGAFASLFSNKKGNNALTSEVLSQFDEFKEKFNTSSLSAEALAEQMENIDDRIIDYAKTCKNGEMTTEGFKASLDTMSLSAKAGTIALKALATAGNMIVMLAISKAIQLAVEAIDNYVHRLDIAKEKAIESAENYNKITRELESLRDEAKETSSRIKELEEIPNLTFVEQEELQKLREANEELERSIKLKEAEQNTSSENARDDAISYINQEQSFASYIGLNKDGAGYVVYSYDDYRKGNQLDYLKQELTDYQALLKDYKEVENNLNNIKISNPDFENNAEYQIALNNYELLDAKITDLKNNIASAIGALNSFKNSLNPDTDMDFINKINEIQDIFNIVFGDTGKNATDKFNELWESDDFSSARKQLEEYSEAGNLKPEVFESNELKLRTCISAYAP